MSGLERKLKRKDEKQRAKYLQDVKSEAVKIADRAVDKAYQRAFNEASWEALAKVLAVAAEIVYNDWKALSKKETRLQVFVELMNKKLQSVDNPTEKQLEVERLLAEQCGIQIERVSK